MPRLRPETPRCGGTSKTTGLPCQQAAGMHTDHPGEGNCKWHGGMSPVRHGRYSAIKRESLRELAEQMEAAPDPLNILPELAQARALYVDFINRYDTFTAALLSWHESWRAVARPINGDLRAGMAWLIDEFEARIPELTDEEAATLANARTYLAAVSIPVDGRPTQMLDIADAHRLLSEVTRIAERIERIRAANAISRPDMMRVMQEMARALAHHVADADLQLPESVQSQLVQRITDNWLTIRV